MYSASVPVMRWLLACVFLTVNAPAGEAMLSKADHAFLQRRFESQARAALQMYKQIYESNPGDAEAAWKYSMAAQFVGMRLTTEPKQKEELFGAGRDAGLRSCELSPECAPCHFWTAINMALYGETVGPVKMLFSLSDVRAHLMKVIERDREYAFGGAFRILAVINDRLPGILGGDRDRARKNFEMAVSVSPHPMNYVFLIKFLEASGEEKLGKKWLDESEKLIEPPEDSIEDLEAWRELIAMRTNAR